MSMKSYWIVFVSVFLAELGDKTQLATILFATNHALGKMGVFLASSFVLFVSTLIAGVGFITIGVWTQ